MRMVYDPKLDEMLDTLTKEGKDTSVIQSIIELYQGLNSGQLDSTNINTNDIMDTVNCTCAFSVYDATNGQVTVAEGEIAPLDTKFYDLGNNFNTSTYKFTAPVKGIYSFSWTSLTTDTAGTRTAAWAKYGSSAARCILSSAYITDLGSPCMAWTDYLQAGDTVWIAPQGVSGYAIKYFGGTIHARFSGHLVRDLTSVGTDPINLVQESWHDVGGVGEPAFENSWVNYGDPWETAGYMKDTLGFVHLKGLIKSGTLADNDTTGVAFRLPVGYRPLQHNIVIAGNVNTGGRLNVYATGGVSPAYCSATYTSLTGITFKAEQ